MKDRKAIALELEVGYFTDFDKLIINSDFGWSCLNLFEDGYLKKYSRERIEKEEFSCSTFMIYISCNKKFVLPHHNIIFAKDYKKNINNMFKNHIYSSDVSIYVQNASVTDNTLLPRKGNPQFIFLLQYQIYKLQ